MLSSAPVWPRGTWEQTGSGGFVFFLLASGRGKAGVSAADLACSGWRHVLLQVKPQEEGLPCTVRALLLLEAALGMICLPAQDRVGPIVLWTGVYQPAV